MPEPKEVTLKSGRKVWLDAENGIERRASKADEVIQPMTEEELREACMLWFKEFGARF